MAGFDVVLIAAAVRHSAASDAVVQAGGRVVAALDWAELSGLPAHVGSAPVLAIEAEGAPLATLETALPVVAKLVEADGLHAVVALDDAQIDLVAGTLLLPGVQLLCRPSVARQIAAIAVAGQLAGGRGLSDRVREDDRERQMNEEIARLAAIIVDFADRERGDPEGRPGGVGDRHMSFGFAPAPAAVDPQTVRQALRARRLRDSFFQSGLFEDPAWDMLLDLYAAHLERARVSVSSLCIAAAVAPTTALRWMGRLTDIGLLERHRDPTDGRRAFISLSLRALTGMDGYAAALRRAGLPFA
ncbi:hypothetical protein Q5H91_12755 [Sphingomonas sp. KR1UV-12]|uniref:HTH marR-type domain-containing protein n=1 Tax=Sphingomonas aurea TaxID=3063994 RepID=A0ABT9EMB7_9SPHN|nr:hypothetical protein [Sphingomonas sp. KR1UV-12]MDP1028086.1 hypothetical protein [Sphingomonas sp. KR1UV-12]